jgi:hypothetical protein
LVGTALPEVPETTQTLFIRFPPGTRKGLGVTSWLIGVSRHDNAGLTKQMALAGGRARWTWAWNGDGFARMERRSYQGLNEPSCRAEAGRRRVE